MIPAEIQNHIKELCAKPYQLGGWLGMPYEQTDCLKFAVMFYKEIGIDADEEALQEARNFKKVDTGQFGDIAVFQPMPFSKFHLAVMLDHRYAVQSSIATFGVGRIEITREPWMLYLRGIYRHELCF